MYTIRDWMLSGRLRRSKLAGWLALVAVAAVLPVAAYAQQGPGAEAFIRPAPNLVPYVVQPGDTLSSIARRHNTSVAALMDWNPQVQNPNQLRVGQTIWVPATEPGNPQPPANPRPPPL